MTKSPVVARFVKSRTTIEIPEAAEFSLIGSEDEQVHASLPELAGPFVAACRAPMPAS
jgi:hypothetical protein